MRRRHLSLGEPVYIHGCPLNLREPVAHVTAQGVVMSQKGKRVMVKDYNGSLWIFDRKDVNTFLEESAIEEGKEHLLDAFYKG